MNIIKHFLHRLQKDSISPSIIGVKNRAYGIDMSRWEPEFYPEKAIPGLIDFNIIKASEGVGWKDSAFEGLYPATLHLTANGAYHYLRSQSGGVNQANFFLNTIGGKKFNILVIDFESINNIVGDSFVRILYDCLIKVSQDRPECKVLLYTNPNLYDTVLYPAAMRIWGRDVFRAWELWIAQYYWLINPDGEPIIKNRKDWAIWQFSDAGKPVDHGTLAYVDRNVFNGNLNEFIYWLGYRQTTPAPGGTMEDLYYKVTTDVLNIRSSAENLGSTNDLGSFNLLKNDVLHTINVTVNGTVTYHQLDKIWRSGSLIPFASSPTGQYWAAERDQYGVYMVATSNPVPTPPSTLPTLHVAISAEGYPTTVVDVLPLS